MPNPVLTAIRETWDSHDRWGSAMLALGAACDLHTVLENDRIGYPIPASVGYRPGVGLTGGAFHALLEEVHPDDLEPGGPFTGVGDEPLYRFGDPITGEVADALGLEPCEDQGPCLAASITDWNAQPALLLHAIRVLDRLTDQYRLADLDY